MIFRPGAGWGLVDVDGEPKVALHVLRRLWAPVSVTLSDAGLSGVRIDIHNDTAEFWSVSWCLPPPTPRDIEPSRPIVLSRSRGIHRRPFSIRR